MSDSMFEAARNASRYELELQADPRNSPIQATAVARAELVRRAEVVEQEKREFEVALAEKQLDTANDVANATKLAAWAAGLSALGAIVQAAAAVLSYLK